MIVIGYFEFCFGKASSGDLGVSDENETRAIQAPLSPPSNPTICFGIHRLRRPLILSVGLT